MMRVLVLLICLFSASPLTLLAQSAQELLPKVSDALSSGKDDYAVSLFRQSANGGMAQTELFYWTNVDKNSAVAPRLAQELAVRYKELRNYDKAYLFYKELLQRRPDDVSTLVGCAEMAVMRGEEKEAQKLYEAALARDRNNLQANIFLGNYYYLQAEGDKKKLEDDYRRISSPTKMQHAHFRNNMAEVMSRSYGKAKEYLERVLQLFPSIEAGKTLERIQKVETELGRR